MRYWNLYITHEAERNGKTYNANRALGVLADTLQEAVANVLKVYPDAVLWSVTHRGEVHIPNTFEFKDFDAEHYRDTHTTRAAGL